MFKDLDERVIISFNLGHTIQNIQYNYTGSRFCQIELKNPHVGWCWLIFRVKPQSLINRQTEGHVFFSMALDLDPNPIQTVHFLSPFELWFHLHPRDSWSDMADLALDKKSSFGSKHSTLPCFQGIQRIITYPLFLGKGPLFGQSIYLLTHQMCQTPTHHKKDELMWCGRTNVVWHTTASSLL